jgi:halimadienyl-diphosphate synthase
MSEASELLANLQFGRIRSVAYDTAWAARPSRIGSCGRRTEFPGALRWLLRNQMWDGSWGSEIPYMHDRVLSTVAALNALHLNDGEKYKDRIKMGLDYIWDNIGRLDEDPYETLGAELLLPTMIDEGKSLGIELPDAPQEIRAKREKKLKIIPDELIYSSQTSLAFSMEFLGQDVRPRDLERCAYPNGSLGCSPSATMFLLEHTGSPKARGYLQWVSEWMHSGGFPSQLPFDVFEYAWTIYNFWKGGMRDLPGMKGTLDRLDHFWKMGKNGIAWGSETQGADADDSAIAFKVLWEYGYKPDPNVFMAYETEEGFKCFEFERNPSVSTQIHVLEALQDLPRSELPRREEIVEKILGYLARKVIDGEMWTDKWHASPFYTTGNGILALARVAPHMTERPIDWILERQAVDGGWGSYGTSTVEETAYAVQALHEYSSVVEPIDQGPIQRGAAFIQSRRRDCFEKLWIAKGLYCPINVVGSLALSVLNMCSAVEGHSPDVAPIEETIDTGPVNAEGSGGG